MSVLDLPSPKLEEWRWADMAALKAARDPRPKRGFRGTTAENIGDGPRLVFIDGYLDPDFSQPGDLVPETVTLETDHPLGRYAAGSGHELRFDPGSVNLGIEIEHFNADDEAQAGLRIVLGEDAVASITETYTGAGWSNRLTQVELARGARLMRSVRLLKDEGFISIRDEVQVGEAASYVSVFLGVGGMGSRIDGALTLTGKGAFAEMGGALLTKGTQKQECAVAVRHEAVEGASRQLWRAVAADQSTASLAARVEVARNAQQTDGEQSLRGLLLKRTATVNLKPELEIFADDVKCAHGATVGELDKRALFYLESRGIPEARATALLTHAFVGDALDRIGDEAVREAFAADAEAWLEAAL